MAPKRAAPKAITVVPATVQSSVEATQKKSAQPKTPTYEARMRQLAPCDTLRSS